MENMELVPPNIEDEESFPINRQWHWHTPEEPPNNLVDGLDDSENSLDSAFEHAFQRMSLEEYHVSAEPEDNNPGVREGTNTPVDGGDHENTDEHHVPDNKVSSYNISFHGNASAPLDEAAAPFVSHDTSSNLRSLLSNIRAESFANFTRSDLEELIVQKICESIMETTVTRQLQRRAKMCEEELLKWKTRAQSCETQVNHLKTVVEKFKHDLNEGKKTGMPVPLRSCRDVKLQVSFDSYLEDGLNSMNLFAPDIFDLIYEEPTPVHPMPMPISDSSQVPSHSNWKPVPPRPIIKLLSTTAGIMLTLDMLSDVEHEEVAKYQLFGYRETTDAPQTSLWRLIGVIKALSLPLSCTLQNFVVGYSYHFAVRGVDIHGRHGAFSYPATILLKPNHNSKNI